MSFMVMRPVTLFDESTIGSFSMRCSWRISFASSSVVSSPAVITSFVITSFTFSPRSARRKSLHVTMPTMLSFSSTTGKPWMLCLSMRPRRSSTVASGPTVTTSLMMSASALLTFLAISTSCSAEQFLWRTPRPPWRARAIAMSLPVTVSMGDETKGTFNSVFFVTRLLTSASEGSMVVQPGRRRTSLKVRAGSAFLNLSRKPIPTLSILRRSYMGTVY